MSLYSFLSDLENAANQQPNSRRAAFKVLGGASKRAALTALPLGLGGILTPAKAAATVITDALQFALKMAHLQAEFYKKALQDSPSIVLPTAGVRTALQTIMSHKMAHVNLLSDALVQLDTVPAPAPAFDFTVNNQFPTVFSDYAAFLTVAQSLEDAGVRATNGRITDFVDDKTLLKIVLGIQGAQARHASQIRHMRSLSGVTNLTPWISESNASGAMAQVYPGEENTTQAGVPVAALPGVNGPIGTATASQAFDEPFSTTEAQAVLDLFLA